MSENDCRAYVAKLLTPAMAAQRLEVGVRRVNQFARDLNLGIMIGHLRLFTEAEVADMQEWRASHKYGKGRAPQQKARKIVEAGPPPIVLSPAYEAEAKRLRGEQP